MSRKCVAAVGVTLLLSAGVGWAQNFGVSQAQKFFRLEWEAGKTRKGGPAVTGYIYNDYGLWAGNVRLLVEALDASGRPARSTIGYVNGDVPPMGRVSFEVPVPAPAPSYRVTVESFEWRYRGASSRSIGYSRRASASAP